MKIKKFKNNNKYFLWFNKTINFVNVKKLIINDKSISVYYDIIKPKKVGDN